MTVTWATVILILGVLIWLSITAVWLLLRVKKLQRRIERVKNSSVVTALKDSSADFERLNRSITELQAQLAVLKQAQDNLNASLRELRSVSFSSDVSFIENTYRDLVEVLR